MNRPYIMVMNVSQTAGAIIDRPRIFRLPPGGSCQSSRLREYVKNDAYTPCRLVNACMRLTASVIFSMLDA